VGSTGLLSSSPFTTAGAQNKTTGLSLFSGTSSFPNPAKPAGIFGANDQQQQQNSFLNQATRQGGAGGAGVGGMLSSGLSAFSNTWENTANAAPNNAALFSGANPLQNSNSFFSNPQNTQHPNFQGGFSSALLANQNTAAASNTGAGLFASGNSQTNPSLYVNNVNTQGTVGSKFVVPREKDVSSNRIDSYHHILRMDPYKNQTKSIEELRFEDYVFRKSGKVQFGTATNMGNNNNRSGMFAATGMQSSAAFGSFSRANTTGGIGNTTGGLFQSAGSSTAGGGLFAAPGNNANFGGAMASAGLSAQFGQNKGGLFGQTNQNPPGGGLFAQNPQQNTAPGGGGLFGQGMKLYSFLLF
jgi:nuclear pore complex protein Nup98-Nup96